MKYVTIGRHEFTPRQKSLLFKAGLTEEVARVEQVNNVQEVVEIAEHNGAGAIVVQALPLPLLAQLLQAAARSNIAVYGFRTRAVGMASTREEAERLAKLKDADIVSPSREGRWRVSRTEALQRLKRIVVEAEDVATLNGEGGAAAGGGRG